MKISKISHVSSAKSEANKWSDKEDLILALLVGTHSFKDIALRLGRSPGAVQRRASRMGLSATADDAQTVEDRKAKIAQQRVASEEDLSEFLVECEEAPVTPYVGGKTYHREYKRARASGTLDSDEKEHSDEAPDQAV